MPKRAIKPVFRKKEKRNWMGIVFGWIYILVAIALIVYIVDKSPPQGRLVCRQGSFARHSLTSFGLCHEEKGY